MLNIKIILISTFFLVSCAAEKSPTPSPKTSENAEAVEPNAAVQASGLFAEFDSEISKMYSAEVKTACESEGKMFDHTKQDATSPEEACFGTRASVVCSEQYIMSKAVAARVDESLKSALTTNYQGYFVIQCGTGDKLTQCPAGYSDKDKQFIFQFAKKDPTHTEGIRYKISTFCFDDMQAMAGEAEPVQ